MAEVAREPPQNAFEILFQKTLRRNRQGKLAPKREFFKGVPFPRSGHRSFTDDDYLYLIGGYNNYYSGNILAEFWAFNLTTRKWRRYKTSSDFPTKLASFTCVKLGSQQKKVLLFGGSGSEFGSSSSNESFILHVDNEHCIVHTTKLETEGRLPTAKYGHTMCMGENMTKFYVMGGTYGQEFNLDVHSLEFKILPQTESTEAKAVWEWEKINRDNDRSVGRYKFETAFDEKTGLLLYLGGGTITEVFGFEEIDAFDINKKRSVVFRTYSDDGVYPEARRCFSLTRYGRNVIMVGGASKEESIQDDNFTTRTQTRIFDDAWILNLDTKKWNLLQWKLRVPVFFHDATITSDGLLMISGGVDSPSNSTRTNTIQSLRIAPAPLKTLAVDCIRKNAPSVFSGYYGETLVQSCDAGHIARSVLSPEYSVEQSVHERGRFTVENGEKQYDNGENDNYFKKHDAEEPYSILGVYNARSFMIRYINSRLRLVKKWGILERKLTKKQNTIEATSQTYEEISEIQTKMDRLKNDMFQCLCLVNHTVEDCIYLVHRNPEFDPRNPPNYDEEQNTLMINRYNELAFMLSIRRHEEIDWTPNRQVRIPERDERDLDMEEGNDEDEDDDENDDGEEIDEEDFYDNDGEFDLEEVELEEVDDDEDEEVEENEA